MLLPSSFVIIWPYGFSKFLYLLLQNCFSLQCWLELEHRCCPTLAAICTQNPAVTWISCLRWSSGHPTHIALQGSCRRMPLTTCGPPQLSQNSLPSIQKGQACTPTVLSKAYMSVICARPCIAHELRPGVGCTVFLLSWVPGSLKVNSVVINNSNCSHWEGIAKMQKARPEISPWKVCVM